MKNENRALWLSLAFCAAVIGFVVFGVKRGWLQSEGEWNQTGTNVTMMQVDQTIKASSAEDWDNGHIEEAAWLRDDLYAHFGTNPIPVAKLDEYLDAESNVLKAVELKTKASFETNSP